ncbi:MAG: hypothetical protein K8R58_08165 [Bacteroidales bacterium]|nr:hypothetical protein [Bacteroidales bacterium]
MRKLIFIGIGLILGIISIAQTNLSIPYITSIEYQSENKEWFAKYGQFQLKFDYTIDNTPFGLPQIYDQDLQINKIKKCLDIAKNKGINVVIFPELSISLKKNKRKKLVKYIEKFAFDNDMIIIAGTFYDDEGICKNVTVLPTGSVFTYKLRPSIFESSTKGGNGMSFSDTLHLFNTKYGDFLTLVCVDLISDDANYKVRELSNKGLLDMLINISFNPKSQEFMREASAITVRHPLFVCLTNVCCHGEIKKFTWDDNEYGNTSVFGSVRHNFKNEITNSLPPFYCVSDTLMENNKQKIITITHPAYKSMLRLVNPGEEALLLYDINLRVIRAPEENNAPDQGYPTIKNIEVIDISKEIY